MQKLAVISLAILAFSHAAWAQHEYRGPDADPAPNRDLKGPLTEGTGKDPCLQWQLQGDQLKACRGQWANAKTNADRLAVRDTYSSNAPIGDITKSTSTADPNATTACDGLKLSAADLTQCRAQWKTSRTDDERQKVLARFKGIAAGDTATSRSGGDINH